MNSSANINVTASDMIPGLAANGVRLHPMDEIFEPSTVNCLIGSRPDIKKAYLYALAGMEQPMAGKVMIGNLDTQSLSANAWKTLRTDASIVSSTAPLLSIHHGLMNVMLPLLYHNAFTFNQASERSRALLDYLGVDFDFLVLPAFMSALQQRIISLARGLITRPRILFLDDYFQGLTTHDRRHLYRLIIKIKEDYNLCIIASLGDLSFNWSLSERIIFVSEKRVLTCRSWDEITSTDDPKLLEYLWDENIVARVRPRPTQN